MRLTINTRKLPNSVDHAKLSIPMYIRYDTNLYYKIVYIEAMPKPRSLYLAVADPFVAKVREEIVDE